MSNIQESIDTKYQVRQRSSNREKSKVEVRIEQNLNRYRHKSHDEITARIGQLEREWTMERRIQAFASTVIIGSGALAWFFDKRWLAGVGAAAGVALHQALQGWSAPVPGFRLLKARTRKEIDWEKYALKALRGDFDDLPKADTDLMLYIMKR